MTKHNLTLCIYTHWQIPPRSPTPYSSSQPQRPVSERLASFLPLTQTQVKSLKVLIQPRGTGKDTLLLPNLSLNCSCTLQSRDWGMNPGPGSFKKVIKIFQDWLGELYPKSPTAQADMLTHHTAYSEVGSRVSLPLCFEKRSLFHPKEYGVDLNVRFGGVMLFPAWPLSDLGRLFFIRSVSH